MLEKHKDRPSCEVSLTLHLNGDDRGPIWIKNKEGKNVCVELNPGDALLYLGCIATHWRDEFYGTWYAQMFMHYVRSKVLLLGFTLIKKKMRSMNLKS